MYLFGSGRLFGVLPDGTPVEFGELQNTSVDFGGDVKELHGQKRFPVAVALGKGKIDCKASFARITPEAFSALLGPSAQIVPGQKLFITETVTVPSAAPYTITTANAADFYQNFGVMDVSNPLIAKPMGVAATAAAGKYSLAAGVYTFDASDAGKQLKINYVYTTTTGGQTINLVNSPMGAAVTFGVFLSGLLSGKQCNVFLQNCLSPKLDLQLKLDDFTIPNFDFKAFSDAADNVGWMSIAA